MCWIFFFGISKQLYAHRWSYEKCGVPLIHTSYKDPIQWNPKTIIVSDDLHNKKGISIHIMLSYDLHKTLETEDLITKHFFLFYL